MKSTTGIEKTGEYDENTGSEWEPTPHGSTAEVVAVFKESAEEIVSGFIDILNGLYREAVAFPL